MCAASRGGRERALVHRVIGDDREQGEQRGHRPADLSYGQRVQPTIRQVVGLSGRFRWLFFADLFEILLPLLLRQFAPVLPGALRRCSRLGSG